MIELLLAFQIKHFIFDFLYQPPYQYKNKGTLGHPGGLVHALQHAIPTAIILTCWDAQFGLPHYHIIPYLALAEFVIHYFVDWGKMNLNAKLGWGPLTTDNFWRLLGFDQLLHQLTYVWIIWCMT